MEKLKSEIKEFIFEHLNNHKHLEIDAEKLDCSENFIESGLIDSMGFLELLTAIEIRFDLTIDFSDLDPAEFTTFDGLINQCAKLKI